MVAAAEAAIGATAATTGVSPDEIDPVERELSSDSVSDRSDTSSGRRFRLRDVSAKCCMVSSGPGGARPTSSMVSGCWMASVVR